MAGIVTACNNCKFKRTWLLTNFCIGGDVDVFDYREGRTVKAFQMKNFIGWSDVVELPNCSEKNKGDCIHFRKIDKT